jgi:hypothetical protein
MATKIYFLLLLLLYLRSMTRSTAFAQSRVAQPEKAVQANQQQQLQAGQALSSLLPMSTPHANKT